MSFCKVAFSSLSLMTSPERNSVRLSASLCWVCTFVNLVPRSAAVASASAAWRRASANARWALSKSSCNLASSPAIWRTESLRSSLSASARATRPSASIAFDAKRSTEPCNGSSNSVRVRVTALRTASTASRSRAAMVSLTWSTSSSIFLSLACSSSDSFWLEAASSASLVLIELFSSSRHLSCRRRSSRCAITSCSSMSF
mmetsp:Transcript_28929/g.67041  ORF Transcript_28929/g.67041 Transcript_28929/m.67041 type:complete len:201 (+) Transcript_28929:117-719(+)